MPDISSLIDRLYQGDRLALSRLLSLVSRGQQISQITAELKPNPRAIKVIAITGSAGVGKSTLIGKLIPAIRKDNLNTAVLACDPQSPLSGGALLGDRFRMPSFQDDGVFIRSLAALSGKEGVAEDLEVMIRLLSAFGFDVVLIETVGIGQGDTAVAQLVDEVILLLQPETGDDLQWEKAGVLEVADILVVQKADLPGAEQVAAQVRSAIELSETKSIPVLLVSAKSGEGIAELWQQIAKQPNRSHLPSNQHSQLLNLAHRTLDARFTNAERDNQKELQSLVQRWNRGEVSDDEAVEELFLILAHSRNLLEK